MEESYDTLSNKTTSTYALVNWHFIHIVENSRRRITFRQKYKNPWTVEVTERIQRDVFLEGFKAVRDYKIQFGKSIEVERDRNSVGTVYTIKFDHLGAFKFHISKLCNLSRDQVSHYFEKITDNGTARLAVTSSKLATLQYKVSTATLKLNFSYNVVNKYGNVISF